MSGIRLWLRRTFCKHIWLDSFTFDSSFEVELPSGRRRVVGQAVMMDCPRCGAMKRRLLTESERVGNMALPHWGEP